MLSENLTNLVNEKILNHEIKRPIICLIDGDDIRMQEAVSQLINMDVVLLTNNESLDIIVDESVKLYLQKPEVIPNLINKIIPLTQAYKKPFEYNELEKWSTQAPNFAMMLLKAGYVDCVVGGCSYPTSSIISPVLKLIKPQVGSNIISSYMLLEKGDETLFFSDCALNITPDAQQLAQIALQTYNSVLAFGIEPKMALLSYSTLGSGSGSSVDIVKEACQIIKDQYPSISHNIIGEIQFDAAYDQKVRTTKIPNCEMDKINTYIFPDLNSGNIGYKIAQYLGEYQAIGPILQASSLPVNDLSRGASVSDIIKVIYLTILQIKEKE